MIHWVGRSDIQERKTQIPVGEGRGIYFKIHPQPRAEGRIAPRDLALFRKDPLFLRGSVSNTCFSITSHQKLERKVKLHAVPKRLILLQNQQ